MVFYGCLGYCGVTKGLGKGNEPDSQINGFGKEFALVVVSDHMTHGENVAPGCSFPKTNKRSVRINGSRGSGQMHNSQGTLITVVRLAGERE